MFIEESVWIKKCLAMLDLLRGSTVLDIGSSNKEVRCSIQSHINNNVFAPLIERGWRIVHLDKKSGEGIDFVGDIEDIEIKNKIPLVFNLVICTNLLEHVNDVKAAMKNVVNFVSKDGYLLLNAPNKYPRHKDPIDTLYRPSDKELQELISGDVKFKVICSEILDIRDPKYYFYESIIPFYGYRRFWRYYFKRLRWKVSCLLVQII
jgi:SAM-dependent methyltransferase